MAIVSHRILGVPVAGTTYREAFEQLSTWARSNDKVRLVEAANTHVLSLARHDPEFGNAISRFDLILPDGMPLVWVLNRRYQANLKDRVYGPTLMAKAFEWSQELEHRHIRHFLLGSTPDILQKLQENLAQKYPSAVIAGALSPAFRQFNEQDHQEIEKTIADSQANFIWTCFGCPKQETYLAERRAHLPTGCYFGIGAAFAFHAGVVKQAPLWIQRIGMEWLFRMLTEPRRLFTRYLVNNYRFLKYLAFEPRSVQK